MAELTSETKSSDSVFGTKSSPDFCKPEPTEGSAGASPLCPHCKSKRVWRDAHRYSVYGDKIQRWLCRDCALRFSDPEAVKKSWSTREKAARKAPANEIISRNDIVTSYQICVDNTKETKNLVYTQEIKTCAGEESLDIKGKLVQFAFYCQKEGMSNSTVKTFNQAMTRMSKVANLNDPETFKEALTKIDVVENTKVSYCIAYTVFLRFIGKTWKAPKYTFHQKLPEFLPTEAEIDQLIASSGPKVSTLLQLVKETGMRIGECISLPWTCIDFEKRIIVLTIAEKNGLPRVFKVSSALMGMIGSQPKGTDKVFGKTTTTTAMQCLRQTRIKLGAKISNPRIAKIHFHLIRHWFGTMEYHKRPDMDHVRRLLGHKSILNTQLYVNMEKVFFNESNEEYTVKVASTIEESCKLVEVGFEFVTEMEGKKIFRKRK